MNYAVSAYNTVYNNPSYRSCSERQPLDDHDRVSTVLLEALEDLFLRLEHLGMLSRLQDQPDLLLDESTKLLDTPRIQVPGIFNH